MWFRKHDANEYDDEDEPLKMIGGARLGTVDKINKPVIRWVLLVARQSYGKGGGKWHAGRHVEREKGSVH